jgi:Cu/Ag efflux pump CusA
VRNVGSHVGRAVTSDEVVNVNASEIWVGMTPEADYDATMAAIHGVATSYTGVRGEILTYAEERIREHEHASRHDIVVRMYGQDWDVMYEKAAEIQAVMSRIAGVNGAEIEKLVTEPIIEIEVDLERADEFGIKPGDVRRAASTLLSGIDVGALFEAQKVFDVVVWGTPETRNSISDVENLLIDRPGGGHVRLADVAEVRVVPSMVSIKHEAVMRTLDIGAQVVGRDLEAVADDIEDRLGVIHFPAEHHAEIPEVYLERAEGQGRFHAFVIAAGVAVFLLLQAALGSWRLAIASSLTLPLALTGGLVAALAMGGSLTLGSILGLIAVFALATRNAIAFVNHAQHLEQAGGSFGPELVQQAASDRFGVILTTAVVTAVAFLPVLLLGNAAGQEVLFPMAAAVLGGLVTSTLLNTIVTPALYLRLGEGSAPEWEEDTSPESESESESGQRPAVRRAYG